jgi:hypothetical protein
MKHTQVHHRRHRLHLGLFLVMVVSLMLAPAAPATTVQAQDQAPQIKPVVVYPEAFAESVPASEVPSDLIKNGERKPVTPSAPSSSTKRSQAGEQVTSGDEYEFPMFPLPKGENAGTGPALPKSLNSPSGQGVTSEAPQLNAPQALNAPAPLLSFEGNSFQDNINAGFGQLSPPDTNGDVGPNHYVQMTNLLVRVWDKAGSPLTAPFKLSSLFTPLGGQCAAPDAGDPIVLYDPLADRWLLSQFAFASTSSPPYHECIAISKTGDPTGAYYLYDFVTPGNEFPDYPKLGVWPDAYYMTTNQFLLGGSFDGAGAFAFDRAKMLVGDPTASLIYFNLNLASHPEAIGGMLPSDFDGLIAPPAGRPNTFAYFLATEFADAIDGLRLFDFHADFANPLNSTFTERPESPLAVAAFDPRSPSGRNDIQQPLPATNSNALDSISDRLMHRLQYRNFGSYESLVTNHTVNVGTGTTIGVNYRASVRYYQLQSTGGSFSVLEQATYDPGTGNRWMGSAAVDNQGNLAVGYSVSSLTTFPSIRYAGRLASDPPGGLFQGESELIAGTGVQRSTGGRWGDYSGLTVDPADDCTFWITNEYYTLASQQASTVGWLTRIGAFKFPSCTPPPQGVLQGTVTDALSNAPISGVTIQVSNGFSASTGANGAYARSLAPGAYTATASKFGYAPSAAAVTIVDGATTVQDFALTPLPVMASDSSALTAEGFAPPNGAIDPAETVTVNFTLRNIGPGNTSNLVATLLPTGGVTNPSSPATYGVISGNGGTGTQPFTFTADPSLACGGSLVATLHLQDGALDLGNVTFTFDLGSKSIMLSEGFDGVSAPALPAGWTATVASGLSTNNWRTVTTSPDTAPNTAFVPDIGSVHDVRLDSPVFAVGLTGAQLSFRNNYATEAGFDGGVLEISINGGPFTDILAAGGSFVSGGYNRTLSTGFSNPLPGRQAWSGNSNGYVTTVVNLPAAAAGQNVQLRWRFGSDSSVAGTGWRVDTIQLTSGFVCTYNVQPAGYSIVFESFAPGNGALDPGEAAVVDFTLRNIGSSATSNLMATLRNSGGVTNSSGTQTYGVVAGSGGTGAKSFSFRVDPSLACGETVVATFDIYESATYLGTISYNLATGVAVIPLNENFDGVSAPALPAGWTATVQSGLSTNNWRTVTTSPDTAPNTAFVPDIGSVHDVRLDSPVFAITSPAAQLTFRNNYNTEAGFDGGVLEISINGGPFTDILAAGGSFVSGGYNRTLSTGFSNPLPGRQAWSGNSGGYVTTAVNLPPAASGQNIQLRWRFGSDSSVSGTGWRVDTIRVFGGFTCDTNPAPAVTVSPAQTVQYSDPAAATITAVDSFLDLPFTLSTEWNYNGGAFASGLPAWLSAADNGCNQGGGLATCTWALSGNALTAPGTYVVRATVTDSQGDSADQDVTIIVAQEDARVTYTGLLFTSTSCPTCSAATLTLAATVQDISVTADAAGDTWPGDIRNADVTFVDRDTNATLCTANVGLVNPGDLQTGTATCNIGVDLGTADSKTYNIGIVINRWYTRNSTADDTLVTVSRPLSTSFITGGGFLRLSSSAGSKAGDPGSRANFGFNVKYNQGGRNLQGKLNLIVRRTEADGLVHVYQIRSNSLGSLTVDPATGKASVTSKATIKDVTNPAASITLDGNATLQFTMDDNGEPGTSDTIGITIWNKSGGLWFASMWNGVKTVEQLLNGGNLVVH